MRNDTDDDKHGKRDYQIKRGMFLLIVSTCTIIAVLAVWQHKAHMAARAAKNRKIHIKLPSSLRTITNIGPLKDKFGNPLLDHNHHKVPGDSGLAASNNNPRLHSLESHHHHGTEWQDRSKKSLLEKFKGRNHEALKEVQGHDHLLKHMYASSQHEHEEGQGLDVLSKKLLQAKEKLVADEER